MSEIKDSPTTMISMLTDAQAAELSTACPFWKILADCETEIPAEAGSVGAAAQMIFTLASQNQDVIENDPTVNALAAKYSLDAHAIVKQLLQLKVQLGGIYYDLAMEITRSTYKG